MVILGIDPSLRRTGFCVIRFLGSPTLLHYGAIETDISMSQTQCLIKIAKTLAEIALGFEVDAISIEDNAAHIGKNEDTGRRYTLGEVSGAIKFALAAKCRIAPTPTNLMQSRKLILSHCPWKNQKKLVHEAVQAIVGREFGTDEADAIVSANFLAMQLGLPHWDGSVSDKAKVAIERCSNGQLDAERIVKKVTKLKTEKARYNAIMKVPPYVFSKIDEMKLSDIVRAVVERRKNAAEESK